MLCKFRPEMKRGSKPLSWCTVKYRLIHLGPSWLELQVHTRHSHWSHDDDGDLTNERRGSCAVGSPTKLDMWRCGSGGGVCAVGGMVKMWKLCRFLTLLALHFPFLLATSTEYWCCLLDPVTQHQWLHSTLVTLLCYSRPADGWAVANAFTFNIHLTHFYLTFPSVVSIIAIFDCSLNFKYIFTTLLHHRNHFKLHH